MSHQSRVHSGPFVRYFVSFLTASGCLLAAHHAAAWPGDVVYPGVTYEYRSGNLDFGTGAAPQHIYITYVDTKHPQVSFVATGPKEGTSTVSKFAAKVGASVAINTNFYNTSNYNPCGMAMGKGELIPNASTSCAHSIVVGPGNEISFHDTGSHPNGPAPSGAHEVCTGKPVLISDGVVRTKAQIEAPPAHDHMKYVNPRTAICMHKDGKTLILAVVDGRQSGVRTGMTGITLAKFMDSLGCYNAVNLDGGGSSTMFIKKQKPFSGRPEGVVNRTSDGNERKVCCHFGVIINPEPPPEIDAGTDSATDVNQLDGKPTEDIAVEDGDSVDVTQFDPDASSDVVASDTIDESSLHDNKTSDRSAPSDGYIDTIAGQDDEEPSGCSCRVAGERWAKNGRASSAHRSNAWTLALLVTLTAISTGRRKRRPTS